MRYRKKSDIIDFFDTSVLVILDKNINIFEKNLLKNASFFERNGIEILIIYHQNKRKLLKLIERFPFINFKIIVKRDENVGKLLNLGIRQSAFKYILFLDPEVEFITDIIYQLRYIIANYPKTYVTDKIYSNSFINNIFKKYNERFQHNCILVTKNDLIKTHKFDEGSDNLIYHQMTRRLELYGLKKMEIEGIETKRSNFQLKGINKTTIRCLKNIFYPKKAILNKKNKEKYFENNVWSWKTHKNYFQFKKYISSFKSSFVLNKKICDIDYDIIALVQIRNESKNISKLLSHLNEYCDGVILLDDESPDNSYQLASHEKLLVKVEKKYKGYFDDLENRNILLRMASFFKSKWFFY